MVGRYKEREILQSCLESGKPEFLALYGRRRVGKTYLIKEFFNNEFSFYATGVNGLKTKDELKVFTLQLNEYGNGKFNPKDWFEAFECLKAVLDKRKEKRKVVFLDELPWFDTPRSNFKAALDYFWNSWASIRNDIFLIVCGSATSWIINNIVKNTGGLYNRITMQIHLQPFNLNECRLFLFQKGISYSDSQIAECYMILGGIPYYLNYFMPGKSLESNIDWMFFEEGAPLHNELDTLFISLFKNGNKHLDIVKTLFKRKMGLSRTDISEAIKTDGRELTKCLEELEQCGFIRKYYNFGLSSNSTIYQLTDPLTLFCLNFTQGKIESWSDFVSSPGYYSWCGLSFEILCLLHINQIKKALGFENVSCHIYSFRNREKNDRTQIDLLIDRKDNIINLCEMKYSLSEYSISSKYREELIHKIEVFKEHTKTKKSIFLTMITMSGLKENENSDIVVNKLVLKDLFV